ncbi:MAG: hypothetical protein ACR2IK_06970, partial [Chloroflexota bacterium]
LLHPGDLDQPLRTEPWLCEVKDLADARAQELRLCPVFDAVQLVERHFARVPPVGVPRIGGRSYVRARRIAAVITWLDQTL